MGSFRRAAPLGPTEGQAHYMKLKKEGLQYLPNNKNFRPRKFVDEIGRSYVLLISSGNHYSNMTYTTTPTPIVIGNFASVLSDMRPTM